ncbi:MAG: hypothetical protein OIF32_08300, partial [Campylobacterales bacterium]|nr:hypothetical protein [Campylobacterales bacterium]
MISLLDLKSASLEPQPSIQKSGSDKELANSFTDLLESNGQKEDPTLNLLEPQEQIDIKSLVIAKKVKGEENLDLKVVKERIENEFKALGDKKDLQALIKIADRYGVSIKELKITKEDKVVFTYNNQNEKSLEELLTKKPANNPLLRKTVLNEPIKEIKTLKEALEVKQETPMKVLKVTTKEKEPEAKVEKPTDLKIEKEDLKKEEPVKDLKVESKTEEPKVK